MNEKQVIDLWKMSHGVNIDARQQETLEKLLAEAFRAGALKAIQSSIDKLTQFQKEIQ